MKISILLLLIALTVSGDSKDSKIWGKWRASKKLSIEHMETFSKVPKDVQATRKALLGAATILFLQDGTGLIETDAYDLPMPNGKILEMKASSYKFTYKILGESNEQIVIQTKLEEDQKLVGMKDFMDNNPFAIYVFTDQNTCWTYISNGFIEFHAREYFKRIKTEDE